MNIHEYQGKELLRNSGVPVLDGIHCTTVEQALAAYDKLDSKVVAVKSQIHAGGRGKGTLYHPETHEHIMDGGVKIAFSREEVENYSKNILGNLLVTIQTGDDGKIVNNLYIESGCDIAHWPVVGATASAADDAPAAPLATAQCRIHILLLL